MTVPAEDKLRCLGYPACVGTAGDNAHVPTCPMHASASPSEPEADPEPETRRSGFYLVTKEVPANSLKEAIENERSGVIVGAARA